MNLAQPKRLVFCLLMSAFALGSVRQLNAETLLFANGRTLSVQGYRIAGDTVTVTLRHGGEASFDKNLVTDIVPDEVPTDVPLVAPEIAQASPAVSPLEARPFGELIEAVALKHGVDPALVHAVIKAESNYQPNARSHVGARGLMQVMPATGREFGVRNLNDPQANLEAGVQYLKFLLARFDMKRAIAAYNAGPNAVRRHGGIPPYRETQQYVKKVMDNLRN